MLAHGLADERSQPDAKPLPALCTPALWYLQLEVPIPPLAVDRGIQAEDADVLG